MSLGGDAEQAGLDACQGVPVAEPGQPAFESIARGDFNHRRIVNGIGWGVKAGWRFFLGGLGVDPSFRRRLGAIAAGGLRLAAGWRLGGRNDGTINRLIGNAAVLGNGVDKRPGGHLELRGKRGVVGVRLSR